MMTLAMGDRPLLEARQVGIRAAGTPIGHGISLSVQRSSIVGVLGADGVGKTALFNAIVGLRPVRTGKILFGGIDITRSRAERIARLGLVGTFQHPRVFARMTVLENMLVAPSWRDGAPSGLLARPTLADRARARDLLALAGLHEMRRRMAGSLALGERKLLEFAMALMGTPRLLLMDEPTIGMETAMIADLVERLRRANSELGVTLLIFSRHARVIMDMAEYVYCLTPGAPLVGGTPEEIGDDRRLADLLAENGRRE